MAAPKSKVASKVEHKSKKPVKKGCNSGASLAQRTALKSTCGMLARSCATTFVSIEEAIAKGAKYEGELLRFPADAEIPFDETSREIKSNELSELRKIERALMNHSKVLDGIWKLVRGPKIEKKTPFNKPRTAKPVNPSNPFQAKFGKPAPKPQGKKLPSLGVSALSKAPSEIVIDASELPVTTEAV